MDMIDEALRSDIYNWSLNYILSLGVSEYVGYFINSSLLTSLLFIILYGIDYLLRKVFLLIIVEFIRKSKTQLDDILINNKVLVFITHIIPLLIAKYAIPIIFTGFPNWINTITKITDALLIITICILIKCILRSCKDLLKTKSAFIDKPLDSYVQVISIVVYGLGAVLIYNVFTGNDPKNLLVSLGAASAIFILVFKDTILGFVASIQVSSNDMVRVGDWIEMPKYGADGHVLQMNLSTVKVQNFDKTITTIPTYALISDSFKNYRGMQIAGGRRIKRSINIKISTIRFLEENEIEQLKKIKILEKYINQRSQEIIDFNNENQIDSSIKANGRRMTNIGLFREYIREYTSRNKNIHKDFHFIVRQLQATEHGLPLELFMFTTTTIWAEHEMIMGDIFDHLYAIVPYFYLEIFELPASDDIRSLAFLK